MSVRVVAVNAAVAGALALPAFAQTQQVKPPIAVYWVSIETSAGMGMPGMGAFMPSSMQGGKRMKLDLGSTQAAGGEPRADHAIPPGLSMGQALPLLTPQVQRAQAGAPNEPGEQRMEPPRGRMLLYWGCGESVRPGQPVVLDFSKLDSTQAAQAFRSRNVTRPAGPAFGRSRTFGEWPNRENGTAVPQQASLVGSHVVAGNYSPEIRFSVDAAHDFMAPVAFEPVQKTSAGAYRVRWQSIPTAIGYFATAVGQGENQNDMVMWSSSEVQEIGHALMDYLPPAEVRRLVQEKVAMSPQTTECAVPPVFKNEGAMLNFIAYGDELNVVHPPRPTNPRQVWEQQYAVKVRAKSTGMAMLAEGDRSAGRRAGPAESAPGASDERATQRPPARTPGPADAIQEGFGILRGILGR